MMPRKACDPATRAGADGSSTEAEAVDLPGCTAHRPNVTPAPAPHKRRLLIVWRNGLMPLPPEQQTLTALQFAFLLHETRTLPAS